MNDQSAARKSLWWLAVWVPLTLAACTGAGLNNDGSGGAVTATVLGPVITGIDVTGAPPAPPECGTPNIPYGLSSGGQNLEITGENFQQGALVRVGPSLAAIGSVSGTFIAATLPAGSPGVADVVVINPDSQIDSIPGAVLLCADGGASAPQARLVASPSRVQKGDAVNVELQVIPGTQDDLRDLRPTVSVLSGAADRLSGPSPAGADLLIGAAPAVFRYVFVPTAAGDLQLDGQAAGFNVQLDTQVVVTPATPADVCVEPLLIFAQLDRTNATVGQIVRLFLRVANAGTETVTLVTPEGADPDGDAGATPPDPLPTPSGDGDAVLSQVSAQITNGTGACTSPVFPALPTCSLDSNSIAEFTFTYTASVAGILALQANASGTATGCTGAGGVVRGITKLSQVLAISASP